MAEYFFLIHFFIFIDQDKAVLCVLFQRNHLLGTLDFTSSEYWVGLQFFLEYSHPAILTSHVVNEAYWYLLQFYG